MLLHNENSGWWDDVRTDGVETAADVVAAALGAAQEDLAKALGENPDQWSTDVCTPWCTATP